MTAVNLLSTVSSYLSSPLTLANAALQKKEVAQLGEDLSSGNLLLAKNDAQKALKAFNTSLGFNSSLNDVERQTVNSGLKSIIDDVQGGKESAAATSYNQIENTLSSTGAISTMDSPTLSAVAMAASNYVTGTTINSAVIDALANSSTASEAAFIYNAVGTATTLSYEAAGTVFSAKA